MLSRIERIAAWLKEGYPQGIPESDFVPLLALLQRRLSDEEIDQLADRLVRTELEPASRLDISAEYLRITHELPDESELERIAEALRQAGVELFEEDPAWRSP